MDLSQILEAKNVQIRLYEKGDEDKIAILLDRIFDGWPKFDIDCSIADHWRWKYFDTPGNNGVYAHTVAEADGEIIGAVHSMLFNIKIGEGRYLSHKGADSAVDSAYRGQGIYTKLTKLKHQYLSGTAYGFDYALSNNPIFVKSGERKRLRNDPDAEAPFPHPLKSLIRISDVGDYFEKTGESEDPLKSTILRMGVYGSKTLNRITHLNPKTRDTDAEIVEISRFDDKVNEFYSKINSKYYFIIEKTKDYLNWRYCDARGGKSRVWVAEKNGEILGYIVLKLNRRNISKPEGYIIDVLALNERLDVADNLIKFAVDYFKGENINVVLAQIIDGHPYNTLLEKYGFLDTRIKSHLHWRAIKPGVDFEKFANASPDMIHYTFGEGDAI